MEASSEPTRIKGSFEAEISYEGEKGLHGCLIFCDKNPEHKDFIPLKTFNRGHLPPRYQDKAIEDVIRALADLTVRVSVTRISMNRPEVFPGSDEPYPFYTDKERSHLLATGTGRVFSVEIFTEENKQNCHCKVCRLSGNPRNEWGVVHIRTANHVVFDEYEAEHTSCHMFDDGIDVSGVLMLQGMNISSSNIKEDTCNMTHATHDMEVVNRLADLVHRFFNSYCSVHTKYIDNWYNRQRQPRTAVDSIPRLSIMVSYCQSSTKQVVIESEDPSCHHQESSSIESSFPQQYQTKMIVPLSEINIKHLPPYFQDPDIIDLIHTLSDLTARISVSHISKKRPSGYPRLDQPFPFHDRNRNSKSSDVITGCGTAIRVAKFLDIQNERCECDDCLLSSSPRTSWGCVLILTSRDVVFDATEAANATCTFLDGTSDAIPVKGMRLASTFTDPENDGCALFYVTHDLDMLDKLVDIRFRVLKLYRKIQNKFHDGRYFGLRIPGGRDFNHRLVVIVSHPHGHRKCVTIGKWTGRKIMGEFRDGELTDYTYSTPTCRGTSGASVFTLGRFMYTSHHPHSRGLPGNINSSAALGDM